MQRSWIGRAARVILLLIIIATYMQRSWIGIMASSAICSWIKRSLTSTNHQCKTFSKKIIFSKQEDVIYVSYIDKEECFSPLSNHPCSGRLLRTPLYTCDVIYVSIAASYFMLHIVSNCHECMHVAYILLLTAIHISMYVTYYL